MAKTNPVEFFQQVRAETRKVTWPTRRGDAHHHGDGVRHGGAGVLFFLVADQILSFAVAQLLQIGR